MIAVIGGGASGLTAAIAAARQGVETVILEKEKRIGKKIPATGNGRCNLTNVYADISRYYSEDIECVENMTRKFWVSETLDFFEQLGLLTKTEPDGKVYPYCDRATAVLDILRFEIQRLNIKIITEFDVKSIFKTGKVFKINSYDGRTIKADKVIAAMGGKASPQLGSNGSGYAVLEKFGHTVTKLYPSLVQIKTDNISVKSLKGIKVEADARISGTDYAETGEILFTDYGLSGPPVFSLSSRIKTGDTITLDIMKEYSEEEVVELLKKARKPYKSVENYMVGILDKRIGMALIKECFSVSFADSSDIIDEQKIQKLARKIKSWEFRVAGTMSWNNAQVTKGGIRTKEINPYTMESRLVPGMYICGEILDVDGDCGGFNLQWAWSSGYIAGSSAADKKKV